jgi:lipoyl(octanoyl) transferase
VTERVPLRRQPGGAYLYDLPGLTPYEDAATLMAELAAARSQGAVPDTVIFCEHPPVVTLGASADEAADAVSRATLEQHGIAVAVTDRGGRATYHGPGQLVCYPVLDLTDYGRDLRAYVERLESAVIAALEELGVPAEVRPGAEFVGVWTPAGAKIASIGIHVSRWVTSHGFAVNVSCDLEPFSLFHPCGHEGLAVTSVERETGRTVARAQAQEVVARHLGAALSLRFEAVPVA